MQDKVTFQIVEIPASGAFGTVCAARVVDDPMRRLVALKVLKSDYAKTPKVLERTRDEARMLSAIDHPNIIRMEQLLDVNHRPVLVMEWVEGVALQKLVKEFKEGLPPAVAVDIVRQCALGLHAAYTTVSTTTGDPMRIIHRDIKPSNILVSTSGEIKLIDFGIAKGQFDEREAVTVSMVIGSRAYTAPERLDQVPDTPAVDIYSLGLTLFELLTGRQMVLSLHPERQPPALLRHLNHFAPTQLDQDVVKELRATISSMCQYQPEDRPTTETIAEELTALLERISPEFDFSHFAQEVVLPLRRNMETIPPQTHKSYPEVAFLEKIEIPLPKTAVPMPQHHERSHNNASSVANQRIRRFLVQAGWQEYLPALHQLLDENPDWTEEPFLEIVEQALRPWWRFWQPRAHTAQVATALALLAGRKSPKVIERANLLKNHAEKPIANAALLVLRD